MSRAPLAAQIAQLAARQSQRNHERASQEDRRRRMIRKRLLEIAAQLGSGFPEGRQ